MFDFNYHFFPKVLRVFISDRYLIVSCEWTFIKLLTVFDNINCYLSTNLRIYSLFQIDYLHASSTFHLKEDTYDDIPCFFQIFVLNRNMKFPVRYSMLELVLGMPIHPSFQCIKLDKPVIAQALVAVLLRYLIPVAFIKLVSEKSGHYKLWRLPFPFFLSSHYQNSFL